jgi:hypothetical protein
VSASSRSICPPLENDSAREVTPGGAEPAPVG